MNKQATQRSTKELIGWICAIAIPLLLLLIPTSETFTPAIRTTISITVGVMIAFGFELMHNTIIAITLILLYVITGVGNPQTAFSGYTNPVVWACPAAMLLIGCLNQTRILKKFSYGCMLKCGGNPRGIIIGMAIASVFLGAVLGPDLAIPMILIAYALCVAVGIKPGSNAAASIMIGSFLGANAPTYYYFNSNIALAVGAAQNSDPDVAVTYTQYLYQNWPMFVFGVLSVILCLVLLREKEPVSAKEHLKKEYEAIGKLGASDKKMLGILILVLIGLFTMGVTKLNIAWVLLIGAVLCFIPGIRIGNKEAIQSVNWNVFIFMGATMGIGTVFASCGASDFIASVVAPVISGVGKVGALFLVWLVGVVTNFFLTPLAAISSLTAPLVSIGNSVGLNTLPIIYAFRSGVSQLLLPYEIAPCLLMFSYGMCSLKQFAKVMGAVLVLNGVFLIVVMVPYWNLIGLF